MPVEKDGIFSGDDVWQSCSNQSFYDDFEEDVQWRRSSRQKASSVVVFVFGLTANGRTVTARVHGFRPGFYVADGTEPRAQKIQNLLRYLGARTQVRRGRPLYGWCPVKRSDGTYDADRQQVRQYVHVDFPNESNLRQAMWTLEKRGYKVHETKIQDIQKFLIKRNLVASSWCTMSNYKHCDGRTTFSCLEVRADLRDVMAVDEERTAPVVLASVDIECDSADNGFPSFERDPIINVGCTFHTFGAPDDQMLLTRVMLCLGETDPVEGVDVRWYKTERGLLDAFHDMLAFVDPTFVVSFNGSGFDWRYISERDHRNGGSNGRFLYLGRIFSEKCPLYRKELSSSALSQNVLSYFPMAGRVNLDIMQYFKARCKFDSYSLENIAKQLLGKNVGKVRLDLEGWGKHEIAVAASLLSKRCPVEAETLSTMVEGWSKVAVPTLEELSGAAERLRTIKALLPQQCSSESAEELVEHRELFRQMNRAILSVGDDNYRKLFAMYRMSPAARSKIVEYGVMDCVLPLQLIVHQTVVENLTAMSQVTHTLYSDILLRGQQIKVLNQLYRFASPRGIVVEKVDVGWDTTQKFEGATVVEPKKGFYGHEEAAVVLDDDAIETDVVDVVDVVDVAATTTKTKGLVVCLDFASLYPSIIRAYRLCYTNLVCGEKLEVLREHEAAVSRGADHREIATIRRRGVVFGNPEYYEKCSNGSFDHYDIGGRRWTFSTRTSGILPEICAELLRARKLRKKSMKEAALKAREATDDAERAGYEQVRRVHDAFQLNLKISCNSVYGFTGVSYSKGMGSCMPISTAVTYNGRKMIEDTKRYMEQQYNANVIYGDTDSVFVIFPNVNTVRRAFEVGIEAGERATAALWGDKNRDEKIVDLEFEKVYGQFLLLKKKNYVGLKYEGSWDFPPKIDAKGIPLVRRDNCKILRDALGGILDAVLKKGSSKAAEDILIQTLGRLVRSEFGKSDYVVTKTRKRDYKIPKVVEVPVFESTSAVHRTPAGLKYFALGKQHHHLKLNATAMCVLCPGCETAIADQRPSHVARALTNYRNASFTGRTELQRLYSEHYGKALPPTADPTADPTWVSFLLKTCLSPLVEVTALEGGICTWCHGNLTRQAHLTTVSDMLRRKSFDVPGYGDRVPYIVVKGGKKQKMYQRTMHPTYVELKNIDRMYYLTNMLKKPVEKIVMPLLGEETVNAIMAETLIELQHQTNRTRSLLDFWSATGGEPKKRRRVLAKKKKSDKRKSKYNMLM